MRWGLTVTSLVALLAVVALGVWMHPAFWLLLVVVAFGLAVGLGLGRLIGR